MKKILLSIVSAFLLFTLSAQVSENFSDYTVAGKLAQQAQAMGRDYWTTWSNAPGGNEDGVIEEMSGNKVLKLAAVSSSTSNDQILRLGTKNGTVWEPRTTGVWELTFNIFIPATKDGYFNIKSVFPSTVSETWATQIYFATDQPEVSGQVGPYLPGVGNIYAASETPVSFSFSHDTWIPVKLFIDLDNDAAEFYVNNTLIHTWQYSKGSFGQSNHKTIAAMNIFPPSQGPRSTYYVDDIVFAPVTNVIYETGFDDVTAGAYVAQSYPDWWTTWENKPGTSEDALITAEKFETAPNSAKCVYNTDLIFKAGNQTSGVYTVDFDLFIPNNGTGYFNLMQILAGDDSQWAVDVFFNMKANSYDLPLGTYTIWNDVVTNFTAPNFDEWFHVAVMVDLDNDIANIKINGTQILEWQYSIDVEGNEGPRQLAAVDFWPPISSSVYYIDNFKFAGGGGENYPIIDVTPTEITQALPAGGTISMPVTVSNTGTSIGDYRSWIEFDFEEPTGSSTFTLSHCGTPSPNGGLAYPTEALIEVGAKFSATDICDKLGSYITKMSYYLPADLTDNVLIFRIYSSLADNKPGELLIEQTLNNPFVDSWNEINLSTPVLINQSEYWLTVELYQYEEAYVIGADAGPLKTGVNYVRRNGGGWSEFTQVEYGNWLIKGTVEGGTLDYSCWLSLQGENYGSIPKSTSKTYNVVFNATGLTLGETYTANLFVATNDGDNPLFTIPCTLLVGEFPLITVNPTLIEQTFPVDAEEKTVTVPLTVNNSGAAEGTYEATVAPTVAWLTLEGDTEGAVPAGADKTFDAVIDATDLAVGNYETKISVTTSDFTHALIEIPCKLVIKLGIEVYINGVETKVYPNPATHMITVESNITMSSVQIINHVGQVVYSTVVNNDKTTVNTSNLSAGYYFVKVNTDKGSRSIKFVVK